MCIYFVFFVFLYCKITNLVFRIPGFQRKCSKYIYIYIFLNTKIIFLHSGFYNMFVKLQRVLANIPKI
jgi:hypothetical protein